MAEKVVSVRLQAHVEGFAAGMRKAKASVDDLTKADVPKAAKAYGDLANKAALAGGAIALGLGLAVKRFADFDAAMSAVRANSGATGDQLEALRKSAIQLGAASQFSATEAAQGINELAKAGVESAQILQGGLKGALDLAAAGQVGVAEAAETTASALTQFKLSGEDATHVADLLASGANKAQGGVGDLGAALKQVGLVAAGTGLSIEETVGGLTAFASAGLVGSDAGTSFKTMLQRLSNPADEARAVMDELNISAYDIQGNFVGLAGVAGQLQTAMKDLTPAQRDAALATIFGSDAIRGARVLYEQGAAGIDKWTAAVDEQGAAAKQAATLTDNLNGDIERLGGAFDSVLIQSGSGANDALRSLTQGLTGLLEVVGKVPGPVLLTGAGLAALALVVPKGISAFRNFSAQLDAVGLSMEKISARGPRAAKAVEGVNRAMKGAAVAAAAAAVAYAAFGDDVDGIGVNTITKDLTEAGGALDALNKRFADNSGLNGFDSGIKSFSDAVSSAFDPSVMEQVDRGLGAIKGFFGGSDVSNIAVAEQRFRELDSALSGMVTSGNAAGASSAFTSLAESAARQGVSVDQLKAKLPGYTDALAGLDSAQTDAAGSSGALNSATDIAAQSAQEAEDAWNNLKDAIAGLGSPLAQQRQASRDFEAAIDDAAAAVKENGRTLDESTVKGRANATALDAIRQATLDKVVADYALTGSTKDATKTMQEGRDAFVKAATAAGLTKKEAKALADQLGLVPKNVDIAVKQHGAAEAGDAIDHAARPRIATIGVHYNLGEARLPNGGFDLTGGVRRASGGPIWGAGTKTSDSVPVWASAGEFMQKAAAVDKYGLSFMHAVNSLKFPTELARGYAHGGPIQPQFAPRMQVVTVPGGPASHSETTNVPIFVQTLNASDVADFKRRSLDEASWRRSTKGAL